MFWNVQDSGDTVEDDSCDHSYSYGYDEHSYSVGNNYNHQDHPYNQHEVQIQLFNLFYTLAISLQS